MHSRKLSEYSELVKEAVSVGRLTQLLEEISDHTSMQEADKATLYEQIFQKNWKSIKNVTDTKFTREMCAIAVQCKWKALKYVPPELKSEEICKVALKKKIDALEWVPENKLSNEMLAYHLPRHWSVIFPILKTSKEDPTHLYLMTVQEYWAALEHVPPAKRNAQICASAVQQNWRALKHVPPTIENYSLLCMMALNEDGMALELIPPDERTKEMYVAAVTKNWRTINLVPHDLNDFNLLCQTAIKQNYLALNLIFKHSKNDIPPELALLAVKNSWQALQFIPMNKVTPEMALLAVQQSWKALEFLPKHLINSEIAEIALSEKKWQVLEFIPDTIENYNAICMNCLSLDIKAIKFIPQDKLTVEMIQLVTDKLQAEVESKLNLPPNSLAKFNDYHANEATVVILYNPPGVTYADSLIKMLYALDKNIKIALVLPHIGNKHPIFEHVESINGVILPGGSHVGDTNKANEERRDFEQFLFTLAQTNHIPGLAICRGHQFVGVQYGANLTDVEDHNDENRTIRIKHKNDSPIHKRLADSLKKEEKLFSETVSAKPKLDITKDPSGTLFYKAKCVHEQQIKFNKGEKNKDVIILGKDSQDKTVESMKAGTFITFQHHLEAAYLKSTDFQSTQTRVAKKLIKLYVNDVISHHNKRDLLISGSHI